MRVATLLVEDNQTIRDSLIPTLQELADVHVIAIAETAEEGLSALMEHDAAWQLIIVDLFLKSGTGFDVLRACKTRRPGQFAVVLSNYCTADTKKRCMDAGADAVFDKSTELESFLEYCADIGSRPFNL